MKKLFFSMAMLCLLLSVKLRAQTLKSDMDHLFQPLNKAAITSGYLHDKVPWMGNLSRFDGSFDTLCNRSNFIQLYTELYNSCVKPQNDLIHPDSLLKKLTSYSENGLNPLMFLSFNYNTISFDAKDNNLIGYDSINAQLFDVQGRTSSPYDISYSFVFSTANHSNISKKCIFFYDPSLIFSNISASNINSLKVDFGDGAGYRTLMPNDRIEITYNDTGIKELKVELTLNNNGSLNTYYAKSYFQADDESYLVKEYKQHSPWAQGIDNDINDYLKPEILFKLNDRTHILYTYIDTITQNYYTNTTGIPPVNCVKTSERTIIDFDVLTTIAYGYDNGTSHDIHTCIKKPLVIVEGIDFKNDGESQFDQQFNKCGSNGLGDFLSGKQWDYGSTFKRAQWDKSWEAIKDAPKVLDALRKEGYDIIYVDFYDGARDMEQNAMFVVDIIKKINNEYGSCKEQDIAVLGASMGGQVAKYALSYMETNKIKHCSRLYVSFDSPHRGANIPIGLQLTLQYLDGYVPKMEPKYIMLATNKAVTQLLNNHVLAFNFGTHQDRTDWVNKVQQVGNFPKLTRNIAVCNGSTNSLQYPFAPGEILARFGRWSSAFNGKGLRWLQGPYADIFALAGTNGDKDKNKHHVVAMCNSRIKNYVEYEVPAGTPNWDNCPGGGRSDLKSFNVNAVIWNSKAFHETFCFIPTISSLDVNTNDINYNVVQNWPTFKKPHPNGDSPFEAYFGQENENQGHVTMYEDNGEWIRKELVKNENDLPSVLPTSIAGNSYNYYNFANRCNRTLHSVVINANGKVQINGIGDATNLHVGVAGVGSDVLKNDYSNNIFEVNTSQCGTYVSMIDGGVFELGAANSQNKGWLNALEGSFITIYSGGILRINEGSKLIIKKGASLIIEQGAIIELNGPNALIEVEDGGVVHIADNATLSFTGTGRIKFTDFWPYYQNVTCGSNSRINLSGSSTVTPQRDHVVLEVAGDESLSLPDNLAEFKVENATINLGGNCRINAACPIWFNDVRVAATDPNQLHRGLHTFGQGNIHITMSTFKNGVWGIHADNSYYRQTIQVNNTTFRDCNTGIYVYDKGLVFDNLEFENCNTGVFAVHMSKSSNISHSFHTGAPYSHATSVKFIGMSGGNLTATGNDFSWNTTSGLWYKGPALTLRCNRINNNAFGVYATPITLNMSEAYSKTAGRNKVTDNTFHNIQLPYCTNILLEKGYNDFSFDNAFTGYKSIVGKSNNYHWMMVDANGVIQNITNITLNASNNHWDANANDNNPNQRMVVKHRNAIVTQPVTVVDASPLATGIIQPMSQCPPSIIFDNPSIALPPGDGGVNINGTLFIGVPIEQAVSQALMVQYQDNNLLTAIDMWHDIITHVNYKMSTIGVRKLIDLSYGKMLEALGDAAADGSLPITRDGNMHPTFDKVIAVNNYFLTNAPTTQNGEIVPGEVILSTNGSFGTINPEPDPNNPDLILEPAPVEEATDYGRKLELNYNTAFTYRMAELRQTCLDQLNAMQTWVAIEDLPLLNYYQCILEKEIAVINGSISKYAIDSIEICQYPEGMLQEVYMKPAFNSNESNNSNELKAKKVLIAPNPTNGITNIEIQLIKDSEVSLNIADVTGKKIKQLVNTTTLFEGVNNVNIDLSSYSAGVYIIEIKIGNTTKKLKLVKE